MGKEVCQKSAFVTNHSLHKFVRKLAFWAILCNIPTMFRQLMEVVLDGMLWKVCFVYIDDILIRSKTLEEHLPH